MQQSNFINPSQACKLFGIHRSTLWRWLRDTRLPRYKIGSKVLFKECELEEFTRIKWPEEVKKK